MQSDQKIGLCLLIGLLGFAAALGVGRREQPVQATGVHAELASLTEIVPADDELLPVSEVAEEPVLDEPVELPELAPVGMIPAGATGEDSHSDRVFQGSVSNTADRRIARPRLEPDDSTRDIEPVPATDGTPFVAPESPQPRFRSYTVRSGDTLSGIASRELGDVGRYVELFEANQDTLGHPDALRVGQVLKIPGNRVFQLSELPSDSSIR